MILLWVLWSKGYVVESIRQTGAIDDRQLKQPVGAWRIVGFALIVAGLVGVLLYQQLELGAHILAASLVAFVVGILLAWKGKGSAAAA
jgi:PAT family beta-lactamase induction signal transducer AmpG